MSKPGTGSKILVTLGLTALYFSVFVAHTVYETVNTEVDTLAEGFGLIIAIALFLIFWWLIIGVSMIFLLIGKLSRHGKFVQLLTTIGVIPSLLLIAFPLVGASDTIDVESVLSIAISLLPGEIILLVNMMGWVNQKN